MIVSVGVNLVLFDSLTFVNITLPLKRQSRLHRHKFVTFSLNGMISHDNCLLDSFIIFLDPVYKDWYIVTEIQVNVYIGNTLSRLSFQNIRTLKII